MAKIKADNPEIEKALINLKKFTESGGGWINPELTVRSEEGSLSIEKEGQDNEKEKLIVLNRDILLPIEDIKITSKNGNFDFEPLDPKNFSPMRHKLTEAIFELYNITKKHELCKKSDFWLNTVNKKEILDRVLAARTVGDPAKKLISYVEGGLEGEELEKFVTNRFISSRVLAFGGNEKTGDLEANKTSVIMPFIDFFNHHCNGSRFLSPQLDTLEVRFKKPIPESNECYAFYGVMDALDTYLRYGFIDQSATIIRSIPLKIDIPDFGRIIVNSSAPFRIKKLELNKKVKDLEQFLPTMQKKHDVLTVSHLYIPVENSPFALKRVLGICISNLAGRQLERQKHLSLIHDAENFVKEQNIAFFKDLRDYLENIKKETGSDSAVENALILAKTQERKAINYQIVTQAA